ncbi:hypothetical protein BGX29_000447, partial [Mortierella sp. GBA35]
MDPQKDGVEGAQAKANSALQDVSSHESATGVQDQHTACDDNNAQALAALVEQPLIIDAIRTLLAQGNCRPGDSVQPTCNPLLSNPNNPTISSIADHPLSQLLVGESSILDPLVERIQDDISLQQHLFAIVNLSKTDTSASRAAANAITILVKGGIPLSGLDLRGVRIPGADLTGGVMDTTDFRGADLNGVNFTRTWLRRTKFNDAQMESVRFGELPYMKETVPVFCCVYAPDGKTFCSGLMDGSISAYDPTTWTRMFT